MGSSGIRDAAAAVLVVAWLLASRRYSWMRGLTYRKEVVPERQELMVKAGFYLGVIGVIDAVLRRSLSMVLQSDQASALLRVLLIWLPLGGWVLRGPCNPSSSTRDDSGFVPAAQHWAIWRWMSKFLFGHTRIVLSEEWLGLSEAEILGFTEGHEAPYIIPMHPHGILPWGGIINGMTWYGSGMKNVTASGAEVPKTAKPGPLLHQEFFPHMQLRAAVATGVFWFPGFREMYQQLGCVECTKPFMQAVLRRGKCLAVYPGGATESRFARHGRYVCFVKKRRGFIRLALEERLDLLPLYTFGDEAILPQPKWESTSTAVSPVQHFFKCAFGLLLPPYPGGVPQCPPLTTVVGVPVCFNDIWPKEVGGEITEAMVDAAHARYMEAQRKMFDSNKALVPGGHADAQIEFV